MMYCMLEEKLRVSGHDRRSFSGAKRFSFSFVKVKVSVGHWSDRTGALITN